MEENENEQIIASEQDQSATFKDFLTKLYKLEPDIRRKLEENELRLNDNQIFLLISTAKAFSEFLGLVQQLDFDTMRTRVDAKRDEILSTLKDQITKLNSKIITAGPDPEFARIQKPPGMSDAEFHKQMIIIKKRQISEQISEANKSFARDLINVETFEAIFDLTREILNKYNQKEVS